MGRGELLINPNQTVNSSWANSAIWWTEFLNQENIWGGSSQQLRQEHLQMLSYWCKTERQHSLHFKTKGIFSLFLPHTSKLMLRELRSFPVVSWEQQNQWRWLNYKNKNVVYKSKNKWSKNNPRFCSAHPRNVCQENILDSGIYCQEKEGKNTQYPKKWKKQSLERKPAAFP